MDSSDPDAIDSGFRPRLQTGWVCVPVAGGGVLLDGWERAIALGPIGVDAWSRFDGQTSIGDVARALSAERAAPDVDTLTDEVLGLVRGLAAVGLVENARPPGPEHHILATAVPQPEVGDVVADVGVVDLDGVSGTLADDCSGSTLLVNWNPNCGYCASIAMDLAGLEPSLGDAGIGLVFLAAGDAGSNRGLADRDGSTTPCSASNSRAERTDASRSSGTSPNTASSPTISSTVNGTSSTTHTAAASPCSVRRSPPTDASMASPRTVRWTHSRRRRHRMASR